jgi:hypothetical protein
MTLLLTLVQSVPGTLQGTCEWCSRVYENGVVETRDTAEARLMAHNEAISQSVTTREREILPSFGISFRPHASSWA